MRLQSLPILALLLLLPACATKLGDEAPAPNAIVQGGDATAVSYFVEFHSRPSVITGHTYLVYGPVDASGQTLERHVVGFFPKGGIVGLLGGIIAAPGKIEKTYLDEKLPDVNSYRRTLSSEQYEKLVTFVEGEQSKTKVWNMFVNNCNDFAADAAAAIGLKVPAERFLPPPLFILALSDMNA